MPSYSDECWSLAAWVANDLLSDGILPEAKFTEAEKELSLRLHNTVEVFIQEQKDAAEPARAVA